MQVETIMAVKNCGRCSLFEGQGQQPELYTVEAPEPLDLVHIDFVSMETTVATKKNPVVAGSQVTMQLLATHTP